MVVSPPATSPASTSPALARRSDACTVVPDNCVGPCTTALRPSTEIFAPMRIISLACKYRFSKIFSVIACQRDDAHGGEYFGGGAESGGAWANAIVRHDGAGVGSAGQRGTGAGGAGGGRGKDPRARVLQLSPG